MNNQRGPVEEDTGDLVGVRSKLLTSKEGIKNQTGVGQSAGLDGQGSNCAAVWGIGSSQPWESRVVVRAIGRAVLVLVSHVTIHSVSAQLQNNSLQLGISHERGG